MIYEKLLTSPFLLRHSIGDLSGASILQGWQRMKQENLNREYSANQWNCADAAAQALIYSTGKDHRIRALAQSILDANPSRPTDFKANLTFLGNGGKGSGGGSSGS